MRSWWRNLWKIPSPSAVGRMHAEAALAGLKAGGMDEVEAHEFVLESARKGPPPIYYHCCTSHILSNNHP